MPILASFFQIKKPVELPPDKKRTPGAFAWGLGALRSDHMLVTTKYSTARTNVPPRNPPMFRRIRLARRSRFRANAFLVMFPSCDLPDAVLPHHPPDCLTPRRRRHPLRTGSPAVILPPTPRPLLHRFPPILHDRHDDQPPTPTTQDALPT